jgi:uncharacterized OB-fold protein
MSDRPDAPAPSPAAVVAAAWREGRLVFQEAPDGTPLWPPRHAAPGTGEPPIWRQSAGRGTVHATTALHARGEAPRNIALVELDEGFRMMSRVEDLPGDAVPIGLRVRVRFTGPDEDGTRLPVFTPEPENPA